MHKKKAKYPCWSILSFYPVFFQPRSTWHLKISRLFIAAEVVGVYGNTYRRWLAASNPASASREATRVRVTSSHLNIVWKWHLKDHEINECSTWCWMILWLFNELAMVNHQNLCDTVGRFMSCSTPTQKMYLKAVIPSAAHVPCCPPVFPLCSVDWPWLSGTNAMIHI